VWNDEAAVAGGSSRGAQSSGPFALAASASALTRGSVAQCLQREYDLGLETHIGPLCAEGVVPAASRTELAAFRSVEDSKPALSLTKLQKPMDLAALKSKDLRFFAILRTSAYDIDEARDGFDMRRAVERSDP